MTGDVATTLTLVEPAEAGQEPEAEDNKPPVKVRRARLRTRRREAARTVADALPDIVKEFVVQSKTGSVPHWKALAELTGLNKPEVETRETRRPGKSLEELLLGDWKKEAGVE